MKKILTVLATSAIILSVASPVFAAPRWARPSVLGTTTTPKMGMVRAFLQGRAAVGSGKITAVNSTTLTVDKDGKSYTVQTDDKTQFRRRFWGKATLSEFQVGDMVNVIGLWTDDTKTTITARLLRDVSIQKRFGVFIGQVKTVTSTGWTMTTISEKRADQTVTVSTATKFVNRKGETITQADVKVGQRVRVRGLWDRSNNTVTEVNEVKDFSLPVVGTTPTATPTP